PAAESLLQAGQTGGISPSAWPPEGVAVHPGVVGTRERTPVIRAERGGFRIDGALEKGRAIDYAATPIGLDVTSDYTADPRIRARDFPELASLGPGLFVDPIEVVTRRAFLDEAFASGLRVVLPFPIDPEADF